MANLKKQDVPFTQVANEVLNNETLSWKAKGLFAYLFSKPDGWQFSGERISKDSSEGRRATHSGLKELEQMGYISRKKLGNGRIIYNIKYSNPNVQNSTLDTINPNVQNSKVLKQQSAETDTISNIDKISNTILSSKTENIAPIILKVFDQINPAIRRMYNNPTQRKSAENLVKQFGLDNVLKAAHAAVAILGQPYAPKITTPYQLETEWAKLVAFYKEHKNKNLNKVVL